MSVQASELTAAVVQYIEAEKTWDALAKRTAWMSHLMGKGKKQISGGLYVQFPIKIIKNASSGFISGTNALTSVTPSPQLQYGVLNHKYYNFNVNFTLADFTIANGKEEVIDFMAQKTEGALNDAIREWSAAFHGSSASAPLQPEGLKDVVAATGTAYAGLTDTDYTPTDAYLPYFSTAATVNYANINAMITQIKARAQQEISPENYMGLMNPATYSRFQTSVQNQQIFTESTTFKSGSPGFRVNEIDFHLDADVPGTQDGSTGDNYLYIFPTDIMKMYYRFGFGTKSPFDGETKMPNQPIMSTQHYVAFNLVCLNRRLVACNKGMVA